MRVSVCVCQTRRAAPQPNMEQDVSAGLSHISAFVPGAATQKCCGPQQTGSSHPCCCLVSTLLLTWRHTNHQGATFATLLRMNLEDHRKQAQEKKLLLSFFSENK